MTGGLRPVLDVTDFDGCPVCGERPSMIQVHGPDEIVLDGCGHVIDAEGWADARWMNSDTPVR